MQQSIIQKIKQLLIADGIPCNLKGFSYLVFAISIYNQKTNITTGLYAEISKHYNTNWKCVERAINRAIAYSKKIYNESSSKPCNSSYIAYCKTLIELKNTEV